MADVVVDVHLRRRLPGASTPRAPTRAAACTGRGSPSPPTRSGSRPPSPGSTPDGWANHDHRAHGAGGAWAEADEDGDRRTAVVDGACVFHNPRGFEGGYGCALHALALREGVPPLTTKPDVCWQLPLRRTYDTVGGPDGGEHLQVTVTEYTRAGWGGGGADFDWYCTSSPAAHVGAEPVWVSLRDELVELVGADVYARLAAHCEQLRPSRGRALLPLTVHPATAARRDRPPRAQPAAPAGRGRPRPGRPRRGPGRPPGPRAAAVD